MTSFNLNCICLTMCKLIFVGTDRSETVTHKTEKSAGRKNDRAFARSETFGTIRNRSEKSETESGRTEKRSGFGSRRSRYCYK